MPGITKKAIVCAALLVSFLALVLAPGYLKSRALEPTPVIVETTTGQDKIRLGDKVDVEITTESPWFKGHPQRIEFDPPEGLDAFEDDEIQLHRIGYGTWQWNTKLTLQPYDFGPFDELTATIVYENSNTGAEDRVAVELPEIVISSSLDDGHEGAIQTAPELSDDYLSQQSRVFWLLIGTTIIAIAIVSLLVWRRRSTEGRPAPPPPKPWVVAEVAIFGLEDRLPMPAETVFVELTDIIRTYIEAAYQLPATERTTPEFLHELNRDSSHLSAEHRLVLAEFLNAADMVKFARLDASQAQISDAIQKAKRFVTDSSAPLVAAESMPGSATTAGVPGDV